MHKHKIECIARVSKSNKIWQFIGNSKTLESLYNQAKQYKCSKLGNYNSIKYTYVSAVATHKTLGKIKIVFPDFRKSTTNTHNKL